MEHSSKSGRLDPLARPHLVSWLPPSLEAGVILLEVHELSRTLLGGRACKLPLVGIQTPVQHLNIAALRAGCPLQRSDLRRVDVNFRGFDGKVHRGALVVNRDVARDVAGIFTDIFNRGFPIRSMKPIERFGGDDNASMAADNTSAYNCRQAGQANAAAYDSPHANGRAVDINPRENPWWDPRCQCFQPTARFAERSPGKGKILEGGPVWRAFHRRGWIWQDISTPDYQHFDTGYPSRPRL